MNIAPVERVLRFTLAQEWCQGVWELMNDEAMTAAEVRDDLSHAIGIRLDDMMVERMERRWQMSRIALGEYDDAGVRV